MKPFEAYRFLKDTRVSVAVRSTHNDSTRPPTKLSEHSTDAVEPLKRPFPDEILGDVQLRAIIVGHNPSEAAWRAGHYYANPTNWMWRILREVGIAPEHQIRGAVDDVKMPLVAGVGFTDVGSGHPGTHSSKFTSSHFSEWRQPFLDRIRAHTARASSSMGCSCGVCGAPAVVAFAGKRQFIELFSSPEDQNEEQQPSLLTRKTRKRKYSHTEKITIRFGKQSMLPRGWPLPVESTEVWVLPSTSGAAPMSRTERYGPWKAFAQRLSLIPWPKKGINDPNCLKKV